MSTLEAGLTKQVRPADAAWLSQQRPPPLDNDYNNDNKKADINALPLDEVSTPENVSHGQRPAKLSFPTQERYKAHCVPKPPEDSEGFLISPQTPTTDQWRNTSRYGNLKIDTRSVSDARHAWPIPVDARPQRHALPSITSDDSTRSSSAAQFRMSTPSNSTMLPSFATFRESTQHWPSTADKNYAMSTPSCFCSRVSSMIQTASDAARQLSFAMRQHILELDEHGALEQRADDKPEQTLQRLIDHLISAEAALRRSSHSARPSNTRTDATSPHQLKRSATSTEHDMDDPKRTKYGDEGLSPRRHMSISGQTVPDDQSLTSRPLDLAQPVPYSSIQSTRLLPSPSSSMPQDGHRNIPGLDLSKSPTTTSYKTSSSLHNASTSPAVTEHIAYLEHQVTVKTMSLQSLQAEHTNMMTKWHRERVKFQTIEKKCMAADGEIAELATKNDEQLEQIRSLETQILEIERKRDSKDAYAGKEKSQWQQMLAFSEQLQNKAQQECQRLREEVAKLNRMSPPTRSAVGLDGGQPDARRDEHSASTIAALSTQIEAMRAAIESIHHQSARLDEQSRQTAYERQALTTRIDQILHNGSLPVRDISAVVPLASKDVLKPPDHASVKQSPAADLRPLSKSSREHKTIAALGRPRSTVEALLSASPNSDTESLGLGFRVMPSTSSPEELMQALGPVPGATRTA